MKNIHIIPTDKPSKLSILNSGKLNFGAEIMSSSNSKPQNIYITNDEEIKEGDWFYIPNQMMGYEHISNEWNDNLDSIYAEKIILTTNQDLIKDGVQTIDDEFLEWFVKNSSCEFVDLMGLRKEKGYEFLGYEIIIPKEESKQETLEEAAERLYPVKNTGIMYMVSREELNNSLKQEGLKKGAKWQAEIMYSEEEVIDILLLSANVIGEIDNVREWFEQFKKK